MAVLSHEIRHQTILRFVKCSSSIHFNFWENDNSWFLDPKKSFFRKSSVLAFPVNCQSINIIVHTFSLWCDIEPWCLLCDYNYNFVYCLEEVVAWRRWFYLSPVCEMKPSLPVVWAFAFLGIVILQAAPSTGNIMNSWFLSFPLETWSYTTWVLERYLGVRF